MQKLKKKIGRMSAERLSISNSLQKTKENLKQATSKTDATDFNSLYDFNRAN
jgi:hypothetical protein